MADQPLSKLDPMFQEQVRMHNNLNPTATSICEEESFKNRRLQAFRYEVTKLLARYSIDKDLNTPDFILAQMLIKQLEEIDNINKREIDRGDTPCHPLNQK